MRKAHGQEADRREADAAPRLLSWVHRHVPTVRQFWADRGYREGALGLKLLEGG